jgi:hypothetical protein
VKAILLGLLLAVGARAQTTPFAERLATAAAAYPDRPFEALDDLPPKLAQALELRGWPEKTYTNRQVELLFHSLPKVARGLKVLGLEFGVGRDPIQDSEPYLRKGAEQLLDWDVRGRVALDGLGARAHYRHPLGMRALSVGFLKYFDFSGLTGDVRDDIYHGLGTSPDIPRGGFELGVAGSINQYWGGATTFDNREGTKDGRETDRKRLRIEGGYSPLGDNPGKRWNYALIPQLNWQQRDVRDGAYISHKEGFGFAAGAAFQLALQRFVPPIPGDQATALPWFFFDRFKTRVDAGHNAITGTSVTLAAEVAVRLFEHLEVTGGGRVTYYPSPDGEDPRAKTLDPSAIVGLDLKY